MTPQAFIAKWRDNPLTERAGAQPHFEDLCALLEVEPPRIEGEYQYERGLIKKSSASQGWADVWKKNCFAWEYKAPDKDLGAALKQLMVYALALDNPPLLVVSDRKRIEIHTHFTGTPSEVHAIALEDIGQPLNLQKLRWLFDAPERFKPQRTTYDVTIDAAARMGTLAKRFAEQGHNPHQTAHFLIQCVFCMFAEDARLLPEKLFETVLDKSNPDGSKAQARLSELFAAMQKGGDFALETIPYFNGGLFEQIDVPPLTTEDVVQLLDAARMDWGAIEPAILGTLFERGLNPDMRSQLGAHYTDPATIGKLIRPVIEAPLLAEWQPVKDRITDRMASYIQGGKGSQNALKEAQAAFTGFIARLKSYRVLDPACGSGNFLYLALKALKDLEHRANLEAEALGLHRELVIETSPANVLGIELNPYAAELARVTVWIGEIQWMLAHGYALRRDPILQPLDHIECRDAVLLPSPPGGGAGGGGESEWPAADAIVGNPPFLGGSKKRGELGDEYFNALNRVYKDRIPGSADLVTYWFEKARAQIESCKAQRVGLVATQSIRSGSNRRVLERILKTAPIFEAWSDEGWINSGAAVRVSLVCFGRSSPSTSGGGVGEGEHTQHKRPLPENIKDFARRLRKTATNSENLIWQLLRKNQMLGYGFRRQHPLGNYILDFYCHQAKLVVELDGGQHDDPKQRAHDEKRTDYLATQDLTVLRFWNNEVLGNTEGVAQTIFDWLQENVLPSPEEGGGASMRTAPSTPSPLPPPEGEGLKAILDGQPVTAIHADLTTGGGLDLTQAKPLDENAGIVFQGPVKVGSFDIPGEHARQWLKSPNPNGRPNIDVLRPWANGQDLTARPSDTWIIDFGTSRTEQESALYELPFAHVSREVKPMRDSGKRESRKKYWWLHGETVPALRKALNSLPRFITTPRVAKHRFFVWLPIAVLPDTRLNVIASDSDTIFGILSSRLHEVWSLAQASMHGVGNDPTYNAKSCFETFPFPVGLTPRDTATVTASNAKQSSAGAGLPQVFGLRNDNAKAIAAAAAQLNTLREAWLNPPEWVDWVRTPEEEQAGFPLRPVAKPGHEADLKKRTLTNLYNARPAWLAHAHRELDAAVAAAYGWADYTPDMPDADILKRLLALNLERVGSGHQLEIGHKTMKERHAVLRKLAE
jgi:very-short-patch-repair endonuclease